MQIFKEVTSFARHARAVGFYPDGLHRALLIERVGPVALIFRLVLGSKKLAPETGSFPSSITKVIEIYTFRSIVD